MKSWKTWLPWTLLALSVALNIFFIGGFFWSHQHAMMWARGPEARMERLADRLDLAPPQREELKRLAATMHERGRNAFRDREPAMRELMDMVLADSPDRAAIEARLRAMGEKRIQGMIEMLDTALPFLGSLNPEQRGELGELMREGKFHVFGRRGGCHRFGG